MCSNSSEYISLRCRLTWYHVSEALKRMQLEYHIICNKELICGVSGCPPRQVYYASAVVIRAFNGFALLSRFRAVAKRIRVMENVVANKMSSGKPAPSVSREPS